MGVTVSLCMIVKNEARDLKRCLSCVKDIADEINIIDTGSTDGTAEQARAFTDRVFHFDWVNDFSAARNFSFSKATMDYIFWLDADDIITEENIAKFIKLKKSLARNIDYVMMPYHYNHDGSGRVLKIITRERLLKRAKNFTWSGAVHESLNISGNSLVSDIFITHTRRILNENHADDPSFLRNFNIIDQIAKRCAADWRTLFYYGTSLYILKRYDDALEIFYRLFKMSDSSPSVGTDAYIAAHRIYKQRGDNDAALKILIDNEKLLGDKSEYYCELGTFYLNVLNKPDAACECYYKALNCKGYERPGVFVERGEPYYYFIPLNALGLLFYSLNMLPEAVTYLEKSLIYYPAHEKTTALLTRLKTV